MPTILKQVLPVCMSATTRAVLHIDLDAFYAQVEIVRLGRPSSTPLVVVQWGSVLAVSYAARPFGIKRGDKVSDVRRKGGEAVEVVSVETIGSEEVEAAKQARTYSGVAAEWTNGGSIAGSVADGPCQREFSTAVGRRLDPGQYRLSKESDKVTLARYRNASARVFRVIASMVDRFERASIDECFIDITQKVEQRLRTRRKSQVDANALGELASSWDSSDAALPPGTVVLGGELDTGSCQGLRLQIAAEISAEIREMVRKECMFTCSAGIATNKMLAKFASATNKPNKQTVCPPCAVNELLERVSLRRFRGCGGKLGASVEALGVTTAGEVRRKLSLDELSASVGLKNATFIWNVVRGRDDSEVVAREKVKSLLAAKNFEGTHELDRVQKWLSLLAFELVERMEFEEQFHLRCARTLTLSFRVFCCDSRTFGTVSRACVMPSPSAKYRAQAVLESAQLTLRKALDGKKLALPISFVGLTASNFVDRAGGGQSIARFFESSAASQPGGLPSSLHAQTKSTGSSRTPMQSSSPGASSATGPRRRRMQLTAAGTPNIASFMSSAPSCPTIPSLAQCTREQGKTPSRSDAQRRQEQADLELARKLQREESRRTRELRNVSVGRVKKATPTGPFRTQSHRR